MERGQSTRPDVPPSHQRAARLNLPERSDGVLQQVKRLRASLAAVHVARDHRAVALRCNWRGGRAVRGGVRV